MFRRVLAWLGVGDGADSDPDLDWADPDVDYGGDGPTRRYTCPECAEPIEGTGPDEQVTCPACQTAFKGVLVPDAAVCPDCGERMDDISLYPETRRDSEYAACSSCDYRWESDPRR